VPLRRARCRSPGLTDYHLARFIERFDHLKSPAARTLWPARRCTDMRCPRLVPAARMWATRSSPLRTATATSPSLLRLRPGARRPRLRHGNPLAARASIVDDGVLKALSIDRLRGFARSSVLVDPASLTPSCPCPAARATATLLKAVREALCPWGSRAACCRFSQRQTWTDPAALLRRGGGL